MSKCKLTDKEHDKRVIVIPSPKAIYKWSAIYQTKGNYRESLFYTCTRVLYYLYFEETI